MVYKGVKAMRAGRIRMTVLILTAVFAAVCLTGCSKRFKSSDVIDTAKGYGMRSIDREEFEKRWQAGFFSKEYFERFIKSKAYFVSKDSSEADEIYARYFQFDTADYPGLEEFIECEDPDTYFDMVMMTARKEESAKRLYDEWADYWKEDDDAASYSGKKNGYDYLVSYYPALDGYRCIGMYLKGNTFIMIYTYASDGNDCACLDHFCKKLKLVKPEPSKK